MRPTLLPRVLIIGSLIVVVIGVVDAFIAEEWDLFVVIAIIGVIQIALWMQLQARRPAVPIRADLVRWLRMRAGSTDESAEQLADRAIAAYRAGLTGAPTPEEAPREV